MSFVQLFTIDNALLLNECALRYIVVTYRGITYITSGFCTGFCTADVEKTEVAG